jgi:hypothetical protein
MLQCTSASHGLICMPSVHVICALYRVINKAGKTAKDVALDDSTTALLDDDASQQ